MEGYVARVHVDVRPAEASVLVDGTSAQLAPGGTLLLPVGDHHFEFSAPDRVSEKRAIKVKGGEQEQLSVRLAPVAMSNTADASSTRHSDARALYKNPWLWTAVAVVVVGGAVGTAVALRRGEPTERTVSGSAELNGGVVQTLWSTR